MKGYLERGSPAIIAADRKRKHKMLALWILITFTAVVESKLKKECPPKEMFTSCRCYEFTESAVLSCGDIFNVWDLIQDLHAMKDYEIAQLNLLETNFQFIPAGFLKYLPIKSLTIRDSTILALESEDGEVMFEGAYESLEEIFILAVRGVTSWRWKPLEALKNLRILVLSTCEIAAIKSDFNMFSISLEEISLNNNEISFVDSKAFSTYSNLKTLDLTINKIAAIERSMFPNPAKKLETLKLSVNSIEALSDDIFSNMPQLKEIHLRGNKIRWLLPEPFKPIHHQLNLLVLNDNDIRCCSDFKWIVTSDMKKHIKGTCSFPQGLSGKDISSLDNTDLNHGLC